MMLINLLPHREAARKRRKEQFVMLAAGAAIAGAMVAFLISLWYQHELDFQRAKNAYLQSETQKLELQIKDVASLRAEIQSLKARQQAVENLQSDRNTPVQLLGQLVDRVPDGVYLQNVKQEGQGVTLTGVAQSQERVSELLRNISSSEDWLTRPELIEILSIDSANQLQGAATGLQLHGQGSIGQSGIQDRRNGEAMNRGNLR
jgi:type IV pilus assembly protein PilN